EVTLTNEGTNISRSTVTNERGEYVFAAVEPGTYKVKVALQGYKTIDQTGVRIGTQTVITLDLTMDVGRSEENVTVTGQSPLIETLDDVKVQVHTYDAEMGRTGGGVFNTTLRSGTNTYRGSAFFQTRPVWGAANNYFAQKALGNCSGSDTSCLSKNAKPDQVYYLGGGGIGGPIVKGKTFFFFSSENYHDISTRNGSLLLPTAAERNGDFSQTTSGTTPIKIYNPITHVQFTNNII